MSTQWRAISSPEGPNMLAPVGDHRSPGGYLMTKTQQRWHAFHHILTLINNRAILTGINITLGGAASITGLLLLSTPQNFDSPAFSFLSGATVLWGTLFFGVGLVVITATVLKFTAAVIPCSIMGVLFALYGILSVLNTLGGNSTGVGATWALAMSALSLLGCLAAAVPRVERYVEHQVT